MNDLEFDIVSKGTSRMYYVDLIDGDDANSGLSPEEALLTKEAAYLKFSAPVEDFIIELP